MVLSKMKKQEIIESVKEAEKELSNVLSKISSKEGTNTPLYEETLSAWNRLYLIRKEVTE